MNNFLRKAKVFLSIGKTKIKMLHEKFVAESKEKKLFYIILIGILLALLAFAILIIYRYLGIFILLLFFFFLKKIENLENTSTDSNALIFNDADKIYSCVYEAIVETHEILNLKCPLSIKSIMLYHALLPDGFPRFWIRVVKKDFSNTLTSEDVKIVLAEEIQRLFFLRRNEFVSDISGLYVDIIKDRGRYYELAIVPVIPATFDYINQRMKKEHMDLEDTKESDVAYDEKF